MKKNNAGFTLIESMIAVVFLTIIMGAIMTFRYYTVVCADRAECQLMASRSAYLLSEAWKGQKADADFDPTLQDFDSVFQVEKIDSSELLKDYPSGSQTEILQSKTGLTLLGNYHIQVDDKDFWAQLLHGDLSGSPNVRTIHVLFVWQDSKGFRYEYYLPTLSQS